MRANKERMVSDPEIGTWTRAIQMEMILQPHTWLSKRHHKKKNNKANFKYSIWLKSLDRICFN